MKILNKSTISKKVGDMDGSFGDILDYHVKYTPNKEFLIDISSNKNFTYIEFVGMVNKTAKYLLQQGVVRGDIVSIVLENSWTYLCFYFAGIKLGVVVNPFPVSLSVQELIRYFSYVEPKLVVIDSKMMKELIKEELSYPVMGVDEYDFYNFINAYDEQLSFPDCKSDEPACLYYSSGTTASPKGILISHENMISNISSVVEGFRFNSDEKHLIFLPLGHTASINYSMLPCLFVGGTIVLAKSIWSIRNNFWEIISKYCITYLEMVPTSLFMILNMKKIRGGLDISSLKWIGCGSSQLLISQQTEFQEKFGVSVGNLYGLSETGPSHIDYPLDDKWEHGSIGFPLSVNECKIIDGNGCECRVGELGEIILKGSNVFIGYYKNSDTYNKVVRDDFFHTGDKGYKGADGRFYFSGRVKDIIIKGGVNILPGEIEEILSEHPKVGEVAVIGIPDEILGEEICAILQLTEAVDKDALLKFCASKLSDYKLPKNIIIVDDLPKGPSGKILKRVLRDQYI